MYKKMEEKIETLTQQVAEQANQRSDAQLLIGRRNEFSARREKKEAPGLTGLTYDPGVS